MLFMRRPDRIVAMTSPPYLGLVARVFSKLRGGDHAHWVMDLYPDVMVAHGMMRKEDPGAYLLRWLARLCYGGKRLVVAATIGPDMAARLGAHAPSERVRWLPLWGDDPDSVAVSPEQSLAMRRQRGWQDEELVLMYSGNLGLGHAFKEITRWPAVARRRYASPFSGRVREGVKSRSS